MDIVETPCPYLPDRRSRLEVERNAQTEEAYETRLGEGFRRSGGVFYRPSCAGCRRCVPLRRPAPCPESPRERRLSHRNADLEVGILEPRPGQEGFGLYARYLARRHGQVEGALESYLELLSPPLARLIEYRSSGRLVALGFVDLAADSLSSAYFAFDPDEAARSLGSFSIYAETAMAARLGKSWYYLGYWVPGCRKMDYKADFPPYEMLIDAGGGPAWTRCDSKAEALQFLARYGAVAAGRR